MHITCNTCGKKFLQSEKFLAEEAILDNICFRCALTGITAKYDVDEEPDQIDIGIAWRRSRQMHPEELQEIEEEERRRYPEESDDEQEWCWRCDNYNCQCEEDRLAEKALEENTQWYIDSELTAEADKWREKEEFYDSFSEFWYNLFGWDRYKRFVAPVLIRLHRIKQNWRH